MLYHHLFALFLTFFLLQIHSITATPYECASSLPSGSLDTLAKLIKGNVIQPSSPDFQNATDVWNSQYGDRHPFAVVYAINKDDVSKTLNFARSHHACISIRSSGHSYAGLSLLDSTIALDVSHLNQMTFDPNTNIGSFGPGTNLLQLVKFSQANGVWCSWGGCPSVTLGGYLQGGGESNASPLLGMGLDSVVGIKIAIYNGTILLVNDTNHPDLFWALRGGGGPGGNFGVVLEYQLKMSVPPPQVVTFTYIYEGDVASRKASDYLFSIANDLPPQFSPGIFWTSPSTTIISGWYMDIPERAKPFLDHFVSATSPTSATSNITNVWDASYAYFAEWDLHEEVSLYGKSGLVTHLNPEDIKIIIERANALPPQKDDVIVFLVVFFYGPAVMKVKPDETAFVHRVMGDLEWGVIYPNDFNASEVRDWVKENYIAFDGFLSGEVYQNLVDLDLTHPQQAYYGSNYPRLQEIKKKWDPELYFTFPQSITF